MPTNIRWAPFALVFAWPLAEIDPVGFFERLEDCFFDLVECDVFFAIFVTVDALAVPWIETHGEEPDTVESVCLLADSETFFFTTVDWPHCFWHVFVPVGNAVLSGAASGYKNTVGNLGFDHFSRPRNRVHDRPLWRPRLEAFVAALADFLVEIRLRAAVP